MSQENVELARRMIEWSNARDTKAAQAHSTDDVELVPLRAAIEDTVYRGPEAFAAFRADTEESWEELRFDAEALRDAGERVVAIGQLSARARVTGADVTTRLAMLFEFRGDKISKVRTYTDVEDALEAAGLRGRRCRGRTSRSSGRRLRSSIAVTSRQPSSGCTPTSSGRPSMRFRCREVSRP